MNTIKSILFWLLWTCCSMARAQQDRSGQKKSPTTQTTKNSLGLSVPIIWNHSEATYYQLGSPQYPSGTAISYGINLHYCRHLYKGFYGKIGAGYFKQAFGIQRPFDYTSPDGSKPLVQTQMYSYDNLQLLIGLYYYKKVNNLNLIKAGLVYNQYRNFRQKYTINKEKKVAQIARKFFPIGSMTMVDLGLERTIKKKFSVGLDALVPIYTKWKDDQIFFPYSYSNDTQQIARNQFSIGIGIASYYHF